MPPVKKVKPKSKATKNVEEAVETPVVSGQLDKKIKKQQKKVENQRGIVFIKHLPHGFFEEQLKKYFEQFGDVTRLRLARSSRTGGSKNFAFVEFEYPEVAQVAAETMDNYLMFKKVVKAAYIPPEQQRFNYFKTSVRKVKNKAGKDIYISGKTAATQRRVKKQNDWSEDCFQKRTATQLRKVNKLKQKYADLGIDFSKIIMEPKKLTAEEKELKSALAIKIDITASSSQPDKGKGKRKLVTDAVIASKPQSGKVKKAKKTVELKDLLGETINDESGDEDYIAMPDSEEDDSEAASSDEETYGFTKEMDAVESGDSEEEDDQSDENEEAVETNKKGKSYSKSLKATKVNRFDELIKRKPLMGGIQKLNKKTQKKSVISKAKNSMQLEAAQNLAKPLKGITGAAAKNKIKTNVKKQKIK